MSSGEVRLQREGHVAVLVLDRPERRNALNQPMWYALRDQLAALAAEPPRVVIIVGQGAQFSSGMDLYPDNPLAARLLPAVVSRDEAVIASLIDELKAIVHALAGLPCVTVAAIEGACYGAGLEVALACDLRVGTRSSRFALQETRFGLAPDLGGTVRLARLVGRSRATDLVVTARTADAEEAHRIGLLDRICEDGAALHEARALADRVLENAPTAVREVLQVLRAVDGISDDHAFTMETAAGVRTLASGEVVKGIEAFAMKRKPTWD